MNNFVVRVLSSADASAYNTFFAQGVRAHPEAFRITQEDFAQTPFDTAETDRAFTLGAFDEASDRWLGIVSIEREVGRAKRRHIAWLVRMYVAADAGGRGIGRHLLRTALARTHEQFPDITQINLTVVADNHPARKLYLSEGFTVFAHEPSALRDPDSGETCAEEQMRLELI